MSPFTNHAPPDRPAYPTPPSRDDLGCELVLRYFDMWNTGRGSAADELLGPEYVEHSHPDFLGPAASRSLVPRLHALYPGRVVRAEIVASDAEFVVVRTSLEPGDADEHPDGPGNGMALFRIADGKLAEQWSWYAPARRQRAG